MLNWNPEIGPGDVITIALILFGLLKGYGDFRELKFKVEQMWKWFDNKFQDFPPEKSHGKTR